MSIVIDFAYQIDIMICSFFNINLIFYNGVYRSNHF